MKIIVGARGSALSVLQAQWVIDSVKGYFPGCAVELKKIATRGDGVRDWGRTDTGIFVQELEEALLNREIDLAVHSMKDVPTTLAGGLKIAAVTRRLNPLDALVTLHKFKLKELPSGAVIGTGSPRRQAQLLRFRPDLKIKPIRGNVETRLKKLREDDYDAVVVAAAGLIRLGRDDMITEYISPKIMLPAAGQGMLAIEARENDPQAQQPANKLNDINTYLCSVAERAMLKCLGAGCHVPVAGMAVVENERICLEGLVAGIDGKEVFRADCAGSLEEAEIIGNIVADKLLSMGAKKILEKLN